MIVADTYKGKRIGVFGLARSGLATVRSLRAAGADVIAWDDNQQAREAVQAAGQGDCLNSLYDVEFAGVNGLDGLVVSPGVPLTHPVPHKLVERASTAGVPVFGDMEIFSQARASLPDHGLVGITGTNGKSTTTALLAHVLRETGVPTVEAGNIGTAVLDLVPLEAGGIYVFEMSSFQIDLCQTLAADIAILLNISPDHLDRHGGLDGYVAAKKRLFEMQHPEGIAIISVDDPHSRVVAASLTHRVVPISVEGPVPGGVYVQDGVLYDALQTADGEGQPVGRMDEMASLPGQHNWQNAAAVYAAARLLGRAPAEILGAFQGFVGLPHRMQLAGHLKGAAFINDSKATNSVAAARALEACHDVHWIAGGLYKEEDMQALDGVLDHIKRAYLIGDSAGDFAAYLEGRCDYQQCGTLQTAVRAAYQDVEPGETVLLSPACASYDQFRSFEHRGEVFMDLVRDLKGSGK